MDGSTKSVNKMHHIFINVVHYHLRMQLVKWKAYSFDTGIADRKFSYVLSPLYFMICK